MRHTLSLSRRFVRHASAYHRSQDHTGVQVRIAAEGPHAGYVIGVTDQTDLFRLMVATDEQFHPTLS